MKTVSYPALFTLAFALSVLTPVAFAQAPDSSPNTATTISADDDDGDNGLWGLVGLLGLAGLLGLKGRDHDTRHHADTTTRRT